MHETPRLAHIGIAVADMEAAVAFYRDVVGLSVGESEVVSGQGVETVMVGGGETHLELLRPTSPDSPVGRFLAKRGEGVHHVAFEVPDIGAELRRLASLGVPLVDETPRPGAHGCLVAFLHPKATHGVLVELLQRP